MKHRHDKIKCMHGMIKGLKKLLIKLSHLEYVEGIIPGRISPSKTVKELHLTIQYPTKQGLRCLAKGEAIQEVFFITTNPLALIRVIKELP